MHIFNDYDILKEFKSYHNHFHDFQLNAIHFIRFIAAQQWFGFVASKESIGGA